MEQRYNPTLHGIKLEWLHEFCREHGEIVDYRKGERLETEGEPTRWLAFVEQGCFKYTVMSSSGQERIVWFSFASEYAFNFGDLLDDGPAQSTIEAMMPSRVLRVSSEQARQFFCQDMEHKKMAHHIILHLLRQFQNQYLEFYYPPQERYERLLSRCPGIANDLPLKDLASFLNIQPQTLSKIRKSVTFGAEK